MKTSTKTFAIAGALLFSVTLGVVAGTPEQEKAFVDKYKAAMEGKNTRTQLPWSLFFTHKAQTPRPSNFTR